MSDVHTQEQRSRNMAAIRGKDTRPELIVRRIAHRLGYRFRLHRRDLPGTPDLVFPGLKKIILVHGCYWHMHDCRWGCGTPQTNAAFWQTKRTATVVRDRRNIRSLKRQGWAVLTTWECETKHPDELAFRLSIFLGS